jgi:hypothetical protein
MQMIANYSRKGSKAPRLWNLQRRQGLSADPELPADPWHFLPETGNDSLPNDGLSVDGMACSRSLMMRRKKSGTILLLPKMELRL